MFLWRIEIYHWNDLGTCQLKRQMFPTASINYERWRCEASSPFTPKYTVHCTLYLVQPPLNITPLCWLYTVQRHYTVHCTQCALCCNKLHFCTVIHHPSAPQYMLLNFPLLVLFPIHSLLLKLFRMLSCSSSVRGLFLKHGFNEPGFDGSVQFIRL